MYVYEDTNGTQVSASGTTKEDYRSTTINVDTNTSLSGVLVDPTSSSKSDITVNFYFVGEDGEGNYKIPEYADGFLGGYLTNGTWDDIGESAQYTDPDETSSKLTENTSGETTYYSITLDQIYNGNVTFEIFLEYKDEDTDGSFDDWDHKMSISYTVSKYLADGSTIDVTVYQDPNDFISESSDEPEGETGVEVTLYFALVDTTSATSENSLNSFYANDNSGSNNYDPIFNGADWCSCEETTASVNGTTHVAVYAAEVATSVTGATLYITFKGDNNNQSYYFTCNVPTTLGTTITVVGYDDLTKLEAWGTNDTAKNEFYDDIQDTIQYYSGSVTDVLAALTR